jgi:hypothetical protein
MTTSDPRQTNLFKLRRAGWRAQHTQRLAIALNSGRRPDAQGIGTQAGDPRIRLTSGFALADNNDRSSPTTT